MRYIGYNRASVELAKKAADVLRSGMTQQEIDFIKNTPEFIIPIVGRPERIKVKMEKAENKAKEVLNKYYTDLIKQFL